MHSEAITFLEHMGPAIVDQRGITAAMEETMTVQDAPSEKGKEAARGLYKAAREEERDVETAKGSDLAKGADRVNERSRSSDGKNAGAKQEL